MIRALTYLCSHSFKNNRELRDKQPEYINLRLQYCDACQHLAFSHLYDRETELKGPIRKLAYEAQAESASRGYTPLTPASSEMNGLLMWAASELVRRVHWQTLDDVKSYLAAAQTHKSRDWLADLAGAISAFELRFDEWSTVPHWVEHQHQLWLPTENARPLPRAPLNFGLSADVFCYQCEQQTQIKFTLLNRVNPDAVIRRDFLCLHCPRHQRKRHIYWTPDWIKYGLWLRGALE